MKILWLKGLLILTPKNVLLFSHILCLISTVFGLVWMKVKLLLSLSQCALYLTSMVCSEMGLLVFKQCNCITYVLNRMLICTFPQWLSNVCTAMHYVTMHLYTSSWVHYKVVCVLYWELHCYMEANNYQKCSCQTFYIKNTETIARPVTSPLCL